MTSRRSIQSPEPEAQHEEIVSSAEGQIEEEENVGDDEPPEREILVKLDERNRVVRDLKMPDEMVDEGRQGQVAQPYKEIGPIDELNIEEVEELLSTPDPDLVSPLFPPWRPKGGQIFVFKIDGDLPLYMKQLRCDGYPWKTDGTKSVKGGQIKKYYRKLRSPVVQDGRMLTGDARFQKHEYLISDDPTYVLFHYLGDETVYIPRPHGNATKKNKAYVRSPYPTTLPRARKRPYREFASSPADFDSSLAIETAPQTPPPPRRAPPSAKTSNLEDKILLKQYRVLELKEEHLKLKIKHRKMEIDQLLIANSQVVERVVSPSQVRHADSHFQVYDSHPVNIRDEKIYLR